MAAGHERRIKALERRRPAGASSPAWLSVQSLAELPAALASHQRCCKIYVGCSPDDWDIEHEQDNAEIAGA